MAPQLRLASGKLIRVDAQGCQTVDELKCRVAVELGCHAEKVKLMHGAYQLRDEEGIDRLEGLDIRIMLRFAGTGKSENGVRVASSMYPEPYNYYRNGALKSRHGEDLRHKASTMRTRSAAGDRPRYEADLEHDEGWKAVVRRWGATSAIEPGAWSKTYALHPQGTVPGQKGHMPRSEQRMDAELRQMLAGYPTMGAVDRRAQVRSALANGRSRSAGGYPNSHS
mmetsp:Transcript_58043/g.92223  ORF Transcript_58043/g.92223 Transcript_58043/m.92223 type:complete len:224 (+) Transcript_58043:102-773(+)